MGLFSFFKKKEKVDYGAMLKNVSLDEMAKVISNRKDGELYAKEINPELPYIMLYTEYLKRLIYSSVSEGGFGGNPDINYDIDAYFKMSVQSDGAYSRTNAYGKIIILNYKLQFLKNYIENGNTAPIKRQWAEYIFSIFDNEELELSENDLKNKNHSIYNPWVYKGSEDFVLYKIKLAISISDFKFLSKFGLYKPGKNGSTDDFITIDDLVGFVNQQDLMNYINSIQTNFN